MPSPCPARALHGLGPLLCGVSCPLLCRTRSRHSAQARVCARVLRGGPRTPLRGQARVQRSAQGASGYTRGEGREATSVRPPAGPRSSCACPPRGRGGVCPPRCAAPPPARPPTFPCSSAPLVHGDKHREASPPWCCCRKIEGISPPWEWRPGCRGEGGQRVFRVRHLCACAECTAECNDVLGRQLEKGRDRSAVDASPSHTARAVPDLGG